ncbi:MAG: hypothetical protein HYZ42_11490 [Bacteroidetes bacterium]|nr:hypothetical protein [Bacteroidota bacterium]
MFKFKSFLLIGASIISMTSCENSQSNHSKIGEQIISQKEVNAPFSSLEIKRTSYGIDAEKGGVIKHKTGSVITIGPNSFVTEDNQPVKGNLEVMYREFHTPGEIIASGVNMWYNPNNDPNNKDAKPMMNKAGFDFFAQNVEVKKSDSSFFESAGMMEITASQNGKPLKVAVNKTIDIKMASFKNPTNFNLYSYSQNSETWTTMDTKKTVEENQEYIAEKKKLDELEVVTPLNPETATKGEPLFDLDVDYKNFPELKGFQSVMWQYAGKDKAENIKNHNQVFNKTWDKIKIEAVEPNLYCMTLNRHRTDIKKDVEMKAEVRPIVTGKDVEKAKMNFAKAVEQYKIKELEKNKVLESINAIAKFYVNYPISTLGYYNCDHPLPLGDMVIEGQISLPEGYENGKGKTFAIDIETKSVARVMYGTSNLSLKKGRIYAFFTFCIGKAVVWFSPDEFRKKVLGRRHYRNNLEFSKTDFIINSSQDIDRFIVLYCQEQHS